MGFLSSAATLLMTFLSHIPILITRKSLLIWRGFMLLACGHQALYLFFVYPVTLKELVMNLVNLAFLFSFLQSSLLWIHLLKFICNSVLVRHEIIPVLYLMAVLCDCLAVNDCIHEFVLIIKRSSELVWIAYCFYWHLYILLPFWGIDTMLHKYWLSLVLCQVFSD